jgi:hypothetical protein
VIVIPIIPTINYSEVLFLLTHKQYVINSILLTNYTITCIVYSNIICLQLTTIDKILPLIAQQPLLTVTVNITVITVIAVISVIAVMPKHTSLTVLPNPVITKYS